MILSLYFLRILTNIFKNKENGQLNMESTWKKHHRYYLPLFIYFFCILYMDGNLTVLFY